MDGTCKPAAIDLLAERLSVVAHRSAGDEGVSGRLVEFDLLSDTFVKLDDALVGQIFDTHHVLRSMPETFIPQLEPAHKGPLTNKKRSDLI
jgi:hypothetical protein